MTWDGHTVRYLPVDCYILCSIILDIDNEGISSIGIYNWTWKLAIHSQNVLWAAKFWVWCFFNLHEHILKIKLLVWQIRNMLIILKVERLLTTNRWRWTKAWAGKRPSKRRNTKICWIKIFTFNLMIFLFVQTNTIY